MVQFNSPVKDLMLILLYFVNKLGFDFNLILTMLMLGCDSSKSLSHRIASTIPFQPQSQLPQWPQLPAKRAVYVNIIYVYKLYIVNVCHSMSFLSILVTLSC